MHDVTLTNITVRSLRGMAAAYLKYFREARRKCRTWNTLNPSYADAYYAKYEAYKHAAEFVDEHEIRFRKRFNL